MIILLFLRHNPFIFLTAIAFDNRPYPEISRTFGRSLGNERIAVIRSVLKSLMLGVFSLLITAIKEWIPFFQQTLRYVESLGSPIPSR